MNALYNENDPYAATWLENLVAAGHVANGRVDHRSIADLKPSDVAGPGQRHFFAGIGGWSYACRLAGIPDDADIWTGSCPCQGFSDAGKRLGTRDPRHLWPAWFELIRKCRPPVIFGEQVASPIALAWLDAVSTDLENEGYAVGAADLCAAGIGAPHLRQRLYFAGIRRDLADGQEIGRRSGRIAQPRRRSIESDRSRDDGIMADDDDDGFGKQRSQGLSSDRDASCGDDLNGRGVPCRNNGGDGVGRNAGTAHRTETAIERSTTGWSADGTLGDGLAVAGRSLSLSRNAWEPCDWIPCRDGKWRPVEPGTFPLAHGVSGRVAVRRTVESAGAEIQEEHWYNRSGALAGFGNAIVPQLAVAFIQAAFAAKEAVT